jgi:hypothetical protein
MGNALGSKIGGINGTPSQETGTDAVNYGYGSTPTPGSKNADPSHYGITNLAHGGMVSSSGRCYAEGGEVHDHEICMKMGGPVPGDPKVPGPVDTTQNDTVPAHLSPHEIVLPNSVTQGPDPTGDAAKFVAGVKGQQAPQMGNGKSFADIIKELEANGLELRLGAK